MKNTPWLDYACYKGLCCGYKLYFPDIQNLTDR